MYKLDEQKDLLIQSLRSELSDLRLQNNDLTHMYQQAQKLEKEFFLRQDELVQIDRDNRIRSEDDIIAINQLRDNIELLKDELTIRQRELYEFTADNQTIQEMLEIKNREFNQRKVELQELKDKNQRLVDARNNLNNETNIQRDQQTDILKGRQDLQREAEQQILRLQSNENQLKESDFECAKNEKLLFIQEQNIRGYDLDLKNRNEIKKGLQARIEQNDKILEQINAEVLKLDQTLDSLKKESAEALKQYQDVSAALKQNQQRAIELEGQIRQKEQALDEKAVQLDVLRNQKQAGIDDNNYLTQQIQKTLHNINELNIARKDILTEIEKFEEEHQALIQSLQQRGITSQEVIVNSDKNVQDSFKHIEDCVKVVGQNN